MSRIGNTIPNAEPAPAPCDHVWGDPQNRDGTLKTCQKCGIGGAPAPIPAPASVPPVHFGVGGCPPLCNVFSDGYRHEPPCVHAENPPRTIINVSVTPASDQEIARHKSMLSDDDWRCWDGSDRAVGQLIARIEQEQAVNAELRAQVKRCHALLQGFVSCTDPEAEPELCSDASKELGGEFCLGSCTTSCDAGRDVDRAEIASLRARLAEVSEAAQATVASYDPDGWNWRILGSYIDALKAVLAKGNK